MSKYQKLPSGKWNLQKFDYVDSEGKRHNKSFTASTKAEIRKMVAEWETNRTGAPKPAMKLSEAFERYLNVKENVLSPSTIRSYKSVVKNHIDNKKFGSVQVNALTPDLVQEWISDLAANHSPKTVKNAFGLLSAVLAVYAPDAKLRPTLPAKLKPVLYTPNDKDVSAVLSVVRAAGDRDMELAIMLAAFIPARRGEVCALTRDDFEGNEVTISRSMVQAPDGSWSEKRPKTYGSYRTVQIPKFVVDLLPKSGRIVNMNPDQLSMRFHRYVLKAGVREFRFHALRHYGTSMLSTVMTSRYLQDRGGWQSDHTMQSVYNNIIDLEKKKQTVKALKLFEKFKA